MKTNRLIQDKPMKEFPSLEKDQITEITSQLRSEDLETRIKALKKVEMHPHMEFLSVLKAMDREEDPKILASYVKALGAVAGDQSLPIIAKYLKHPSGRVRANSIEALGYSSSGQDKFKVGKILLRFLADPDRRVVGNCLQALANFMSPEEISLSINDYFDTRVESSCLNCLFLISQLGLIQNSYIFEVCLSHPSARVRDYAVNLFPIFEKKNPEVRKLLLRRIEGEGPSPANANIPSESIKFVDFLMDRMAEGEIRDKIDILQEVGSEPHWKEDPRIINYLRNFCLKETEPFILATLVKTIARLSDGDEWDTLSRFLHHEDPRVVSNVVESFVLMKDFRVLDFLNEWLKSADLDRREHIRILSAGISLIREQSQSNAVELLRRLSAGNVTAVAAFVHHLNQWEKPSEDLIDIVLELIAREVRPDILFECANFLSKNGSERIIPLIEKMLEQMDFGEKYDLLKNLNSNLTARFPSVTKRRVAESTKKVEEVVSSAQSKIAGKIGEQPLKSFQPIIFKGPDEQPDSFLQNPWLWLCLLTMFLAGLGFWIMQGLVVQPKG